MNRYVANQVSHMYRDTQKLMNANQVKDYIPYSWLSITQVKAEFYNALANHHIADALLDQPGTIIYIWFYTSCEK